MLATDLKNSVPLFLDHCLSLKLNVDQVTVRIKKACTNYDPKLAPQFESNPKIQAIFHLFKRSKQAAKPKTTVMSIERLKAHIVKAKDCPYNACVALAVVTCLRIENVLTPDFIIEKLEGETSTFLLRLGKTKSTPHVMFIPEVIKLVAEAVVKHQNSSKKISYAKLLDYTKTEYNDGTHLCRRAGTHLLDSEFSEDKIKVYGNWSNPRSTLNTRYLRDKTLRDICEFWRRVIG